MRRIISLNGLRPATEGDVGEEEEVVAVVVVLVVMVAVAADD